MKINKTQIKNKAIDKATSFIPVDRTIDARLLLMGKSYELYNFETEFQQEVDHRGQPQHEVKGGLLTFTICEVSDQTLNNWMFRPEYYLDGLITFAPLSQAATAPIKIVFTQARCIHFEKAIGKNVGIMLRMIVSAKMITVNTIEHKNYPNF